MAKFISSIAILGNEYTRYLALCGDEALYLSETKADTAIEKALKHFPSGKVVLGIVDNDDSFSDISDLREVVKIEAVEALDAPEVVNVSKKRGARNPPRNSNHGPRQFAYFFGR